MHCYDRKSKKNKKIDLNCLQLPDILKQHGYDKCYDKKQPVCAVRSVTRAFQDLPLCNSTYCSYSNSSSSLCTVYSLVK